MTMQEKKKGPQKGKMGVHSPPHRKIGAQIKKEGRKNKNQKGEGGSFPPAPRKETEQIFWR